MPHWSVTSLTLAAALLLGAVLPLGEARAQDLWWDSDWTARRQIRIDNTGRGELTDFTVGVTLSESGGGAEGFEYPLARFDGADLRFTDDAGVPLSFDLEYWSQGPDKISQLWVRVPAILASNDTQYLWMYYGNPTASPNTTAPDAYDADHQVVLHLDGDVTDTVGGVVVTAQYVTYTSNGRSSAFFDSSELDTAPNLSQWLNDSATLSLWMRSTASGNSTLEYSPAITGFDDPSSLTNDVYWGWVTSGGSWCLGFGLPTTAACTFPGVVDMADGAWHYVTMVRDQGSGEQAIWVDGAQHEATTGPTGTFTTPFGAIAAITSTSNRFYQGDLDEIRISGVARSDDWIHADQAAALGTLLEYCQPGQEVAYYWDEDADGYGDGTEQFSGGAVCYEPLGYAANADDCDDLDANTHPGAPEVCDGRDNDCDIDIDEGFSLGPWFSDGDGDGYGAGSPVAEGCDPPLGSVPRADDCDDDKKDVHPGATEIWYDGIDQDCDGGSDEDQDGDGYTCWGELDSNCPFSTGADCDDQDPTIHPDAVEQNDGIDHDCNGYRDVMSPLSLHQCSCAAGPRGAVGWGAVLPLVVLGLRRQRGARR